MRISDCFGNPIESQHMNPHFRIRLCGGSVICHAAFSAQVFGQLASSPDAVVPEVATTPMGSFASRFGLSTRFSWESQPEPTSTAVADDTASEPTAEQVADVHDESGSACPSVAGDTVADSSGAEIDEDETAVAARRQQRVAPKTPAQGNPNTGRRESSRHNNEPEVGSFGLFFGNWGQRATLGGDARKKARRITQDRQILKSPAQVIVLCEASAGVEEMLRQPPEDGNPEQEGLDGEKLARALCGARR